jgi:hypothetical protein
MSLTKCSRTARTSSFIWIVCCFMIWTNVNVQRFPLGTARVDLLVHILLQVKAVLISDLDPAYVQCIDKRLNCLRRPTRCRSQCQDTEVWIGRHEVPDHLCVRIVTCALVRLIWITVKVSDHSVIVAPTRHTDNEEYDVLWIASTFLEVVHKRLRREIEHTLVRPL